MTTTVRKASSCALGRADRFGPCRSSQPHPVLRRLRRRDWDGASDGFNLNFPLASGTRDDGWLAEIDQDLARILSYRRTALVAALGLDAAQGDPLGVLAVTESGFSSAAWRIARVGLPTTIIQEGSYLCYALAPNLVALL
ncbi:hypothetical protein [Methylobacterium sp. E-045]|uniref:hypothetical protein n=1 Tax=Methylobacterium sp. E-045 TaxID=2836575 RepID=UPI0028BE2CEA|nr:hypothetical protein [Methylobacterium sp. E-045]